MVCASLVTLWQNRVHENKYSTKTTILISIPYCLNTTIHILVVRTRRGTNLVYGWIASGYGTKCG